MQPLRASLKLIAGPWYFVHITKGHLEEWFLTLNGIPVGFIVSQLEIGPPDAQWHSLRFYAAIPVLERCLAIPLSIPCV